MIDNNLMQTRVENGVVVASLKCTKIGDFEAPGMLADLQTVGPSGLWRIVVDCTEVVLIGSRGLGVFIAARKVCEEHHGKLVVCGLSDELTGLFKMSGLTKLFTIKKDAAEAVGAAA